jgi:polyisoprenoid-binding protein YceI
MNRKFFLAVGAVALLVVGWFVYEIIDTDAPDAVSTDAALAQLQTEADESGESTEAAIDAAAADNSIGSVEATWVVDDEFGEFGFDNASGSFAGFRVEKAFFSGQGATAVGRTGGVSGEVVIGSGELTSATITVDMAQMVSDERARESAINDAIKVSEHPTGSFVVADAVALDTDALADGTTVTVDVTGALTIAGATNQVTIPIEATIVDGGLGLIVGSIELVWADYGVETPTSSVADVADDGILEFQLIVQAS